MLTKVGWRAIFGLAALGMVWLSALYRYGLVTGDRSVTFRLDRWTGAVDRVSFGGLPPPWLPWQTGTLLVLILALGAIVAGIVAVTRRHRVEGQR